VGGEARQGGRASHHHAWRRVDDGPKPGADDEGSRRPRQLGSAGDCKGGWRNPPLRAPAKREA